MRREDNGCLAFGRRVKGGENHEVDEAHFQEKAHDTECPDKEPGIRHGGLPAIAGRAGHRPDVPKRKSRQVTANHRSGRGITTLTEYHGKATVNSEALSEGDGHNK